MKVVALKHTMILSDFLFYCWNNPLIHSEFIDTKLDFLNLCQLGPCSNPNIITTSNYLISFAEYGIP